MLTCAVDAVAGVQRHVGVMAPFAVPSQPTQRAVQQRAPPPQVAADFFSQPPSNPAASELFGGAPAAAFEWTGAPGASVSPEAFFAAAPATDAWVQDETPAAAALFGSPPAGVAPAGCGGGLAAPAPAIPQAPEAFFAGAAAYDSTQAHGNAPVASELFSSAPTGSVPGAAFLGAAVQEPPSGYGMGSTAQTPLAPVAPDTLFTAATGGWVQDHAPGTVLAPNEAAYTAGAEVQTFEAEADEGFAVAATDMTVDPAMMVTESGWAQDVTPEGYPYWYNYITGESSWHAPAEVCHLNACCPSALPRDDQLSVTRPSDPPLPPNPDVRRRRCGGQRGFRFTTRGAGVRSRSSGSSTHCHPGC